MRSLVPSASIGVADDDWAACQTVGNAVQYLGIQALRASSVTGDGDVLALYEPHLHPGQLQLTETTELARAR